MVKTDGRGKEEQKVMSWNLPRLLLENQTTYLTFIATCMMMFPLMMR